MKRKRYSEDQIIRILKEAEGGMPVAEVGRKYGVSEQTIYRWKSKYGGLEVNELKRLNGVAPFQWTVSRLSFSTRDSRRCGNCGSRVTASKRLWESRSDFHGLVSFHNS